MSFRPVATHVNNAPVAVSQCRTHEETPLTDDAPAVAAMVDFHWVCPVTVAPEQKIDVALQNMVGARVRTLLVMTEGRMIGLVTAYDIQGQKPLQFLRGSDCPHPKCRHEDIEVADIMTPMESLPTLRLEDVRKARMSDLLEVFRETRQTHLLVTDRQDDEHTMIRGLFSRTEIERRLGIPQAHASAALIEMETAMFPLSMEQGR